MVTTMAIVARNKLGFDLDGTRWEVAKEMSTDAPRRIVRLTTHLWMSVPKSRDPEGLLETAARTCPVLQSLNPVIDKPIEFHWSAEA